MEIRAKLTDQIRRALESDDFETATRLIEQYRPADQAGVFTDLTPEQQVALLPILHPESSADILEILDDEQVAELVEALPDSAVVRIVDEMEPDEAADLLGDIQPARAEEVLSSLEDPEEVRPLMLHADESAGGLMTSDYLALRRMMTAQEAIEALRGWHPASESVYYLYVVDRHGHLCGVVSLRQLVTSEANTRILEIMDPDVISVRDSMDQEEVARLMLHYDFLGVPVVDDTNKLLGVITHDDVMHVIEEEATEDIHRFGGTEPLERSYLDTSPLRITWKRIGWLLLLFLTATLTGSVLLLFDKELDAMVSLVIFIPLLIGTGGNAGSQTTATIIRALGTGDVAPNQVFSVWWHEARVGLLLGLGMAVIAYVRAITWEPNVLLALTVALATLGVILWATGVGALLPLLAARLKIDPALVSGPVMSTLVDATGLLIYLWLAKIILGL